MATTNHPELEAHLKLVFKNMLTTSEFKTYAKEAGKAMKEKVQARMASSQHDYLQSGTMKRLMRDEVGLVDVNRAGTKATIGLGDIEEWNIETKRGPQNGTFTIGRETKNIALRPEPELPAWIIMEFGRRAGSGAGAKGIPKDFLVPYTPREPSKKFLFGPSESMHFRKSIYFMSPISTGDREPRIHPGITGGHFFEKGLDDSKESVEQTLLFALEASMKSLARTYGGRVQSL